MNNQELNTALYQKMFEEQEQYRSWLLAQPPEEILNHTFEYTSREDILLSLEYNDLEDVQAKALLESPSPLSDVYDAYEKLNSSHMEEIWSCVENRAEHMVQAQREATQSLPVYPHPAAYAREHDELPQYRASNQANVACKEALEKAINSNYKDNCLDTAAVFEQVSAEFGPERVKYVLANTIQQKDWIGASPPPTGHGRRPSKFPRTKTVLVRTVTVTLWWTGHIRGW